MSNAIQANLHHKIVVEYTHKLAQHMHECGLCSPIKACDKHLFLVDELHAAQSVYQDTINRWSEVKSKGYYLSADESSVGDNPQCDHCPE